MKDIWGAKIPQISFIHFSSACMAHEKLDGATSDTLPLLIKVDERWQGIACYMSGFSFEGGCNEFVPTPKEVLARS